MLVNCQFGDQLGDDIGSLSSDDEVCPGLSIDSFKMYCPRSWETFYQHCDNIVSLDGPLLESMAAFWDGCRAEHLQETAGESERGVNAMMRCHV